MCSQIFSCAKKLLSDGIKFTLSILHNSFASHHLFSPEIEQQTENSTQNVWYKLYNILKWALYYKWAIESVRSLNFNLFYFREDVTHQKWKTKN